MSEAKQSECTSPPSGSALVVFLPECVITELFQGFRIRSGLRYAYGQTPLEAILSWVKRYGLYE